MGVDYSANFGIGFQIVDECDDKDLTIRDYLDELIDASKYSWFETGYEDYGGSPNKFFVVLDDVQPLNTLEGRLEELKQHLLSEHFTLEDDVADVVGGLRGW